MALSVPHTRAALTPQAHVTFSHLLWLGAGAVLGFAIPALFSGVLELSRPWFVAIYLLIAGPFLATYARWSRLDVVALLRRNWQWGVLGAVVVGTVMVWGVLGWDSSSRPEGLRLIGDLLWLGIVYGVLDAVFLTVFPVIAVWQAFARYTEGWTGKIAIGVVALLASLLVTTTYHLGYPEFRGTEVGDPVLGNGIMTLGYLLTANPITAIGGHIALHVASILHGVETSVSLPPHY
jgi:hypothetical protein